MNRRERFPLSMQRLLAATTVVGLTMLAIPVCRADCCPAASSGSEAAIQARCCPAMPQHGDSPLATCLVTDSGSGASKVQAPRLRPTPLIGATLRATSLVHQLASPSGGLIRTRAGCATHTTNFLPPLRL
ncbi:MAG: hypothetical protein HYZ92_03370 [Candidatus Omnitrophica bacterium]|nr:hypothetical protein [Candidatus Omnitrophota bacterium]